MNINYLKVILPFQNRSKSFHYSGLNGLQRRFAFHVLERYRSKSWNAGDFDNQVVSSFLERFGTAKTGVNPFIYSGFAVLFGEKQRSTFYN